MQAGYQYDRKAAAKALKASLKNRRRDKVLYGAVIKQESVFSSTTIEGSPQPPGAPVVAATTSAQPPAPPGAPSAPSAPSASQPTLSPEVTTSLVRPLNPLLAELKRPPALKPTTTKSEPPSPDAKPRAFDLSTILSAKAKLKAVDKTIKPPVVQKTLQEIKASQTPTPVDTREHNVVVGTPVETGAPSAQSTVIPTAITTPAMIGEPILQRTLPAQARYFETLKPGSPTSSAAPTETSTIAPTAGPSSSSSEGPPPLQIDLRDRNTDKGLSAQTKAAELFKLNQDARRRAGVERIIQKSETITGFNVYGVKFPKVLVITKATNGKFNFALGRSKNYEEANFHPGRNDVDVVYSLERAIGAAKDTDRFKAIRKPGEKTGLGVSEDPDKIGSTRVVYRSNKNPNSVAKGQLYLMQPQLIRGHIRLYNKSGRPVVSRSNVSPAFQNIARDIVERNAFEADDYKNLDPKETADANMFIQATMPIQPRNINRLANADTIWKMKKRYEVLVGEMAAGNDGKIVRDEMSDILKNLVRMHAMGESKGRDLIKALREY